ncbi:F177B protein, partial [Penelope pileata]|nr:F177B protein [Penelope pileata]
MMFLLLFFFCAFSACEFLGGKLAALFGLNEPKYRYAVEEYYRTQREVNKTCIMFRSTERMYFTQLLCFMPQE